MFSDSDIQHLTWLRTKAFQARERLELAEQLQSEEQAELLLDLIDALGDGCVKTVLWSVQEEYNFSEKSEVYDEVKAMARDIIDVAWEVKDAVDVITKYIEGEV